MKIVGPDASPSVMGKAGTISKVREITDDYGNVVKRKYRVYVPGHPIVDWLDETDIKGID